MSFLRILVQILVTTKTLQTKKIIQGTEGWFMRSVVFFLLFIQNESVFLQMATTVTMWTDASGRTSPGAYNVTLLFHFTISYLKSFEEIFFSEGTFRR